MKGVSITDQLEHEAAKQKSTDLLHQSDQSLHYQAIYKLQKDLEAKGGRDLKHTRKMS